MSRNNNKLDRRSGPQTDTDARIAKVIARAGLASRREAEAWIAAGRVAINGATIASPAVNVGPRDAVTVDGKPLPPRERTRLFMFHKPRGLVTTTADPEGRPTIFGALPNDLPRLISIGRLDLNTEGLLLLTNDGGLARVLEHPATGWLRRYRVRAHGTVLQPQLDALRDGATIDGIHYGPIEATLDRVQGANVWLTFAIREGKNREVRNVLGSLGLDVNRLIRLSFGPFQLGELSEGAIEEVKTRTLQEQLGPRIAQLAGADFEAPIHEREERHKERRAASMEGRVRRPPQEEGRKRPWAEKRNDAERAQHPRRHPDERSENRRQPEESAARAPRKAEPWSRPHPEKRYKDSRHPDERRKEHRRPEERTEHAPRTAPAWSRPHPEERHKDRRHPEERAQRASKGDGGRHDRASFEGRMRRPPQDNAAEKPKPRPWHGHGRERPIEQPAPEGARPRKSKAGLLTDRKGRRVLVQRVQGERPQESEHRRPPRPQHPGGRRSQRSDRSGGPRPSRPSGGTGKR